MSTPTPRAWETIYRGIKDQIDTGDLTPGGAVPSEKRLIDTYGVSRNSVRGALARLEGEGVLNPGGPGAARTVRVEAPLLWNLSTFELGQRRDDPDTGTDEWAADMRAQGKTPRQEVSVQAMPAPAKIAASLQIPVGEWVFRRRRLRLADDVPVTIADTWITDATAKLPCTVDGQEVYPFLEERDIAVTGGIVKAVGLKQRLARDVIYPRLPTEDEAMLLDIPSVGMAVGEHTRIGLDPDGHPLRVLISVFPGPRLSLAYELHYPA